MPPVLFLDRRFGALVDHADGRRGRLCARGTFHGQVWRTCR